MEQRRLRLGDILDDYCPRERRVTNHVVVAMIEEQVKQTRCSTCDADHEYKQARVPVLRKKKEAGALAAEVAAEVPRARRPETVDVPDAVEERATVIIALETEAVADVDTLAADEPARDERDDDGPVHRRLIRATLPRPEGQVPERKEPEFTVRQQGARGHEIDGNRPSHGQKRHRRPHRGGGSGDTRFGGVPNGNGPRGGGNGNRGPHSQHGQPGGSQPGGHRGGGRPAGDARPGGEGRFRRRRGR